MEPGDHAALAAAGHEQGEHTLKVQYEDCSAEVLDLVSMAKIGCPCTELCTLQQDCSRATPVMHHRRKWVMAKHDTEENKQLLLAMDSEAPKKLASQKREIRVRAAAAAKSAPKAATAPRQGGDSSSSDDDTTRVGHMACQLNKKPRLRSQQTNK